MSFGTPQNNFTGSPNNVVDNVRRVVDFGEGPTDKHPKPSGRDAFEVGGVPVAGTVSVFTDHFRTVVGFPRNPVFRPSYVTNLFGATGGIGSAIGGGGIDRTAVLTAFAGAPPGRSIVAANIAGNLVSNLAAVSSTSGVSGASGVPSGVIAYWHYSLPAPAGWTIMPSSNYAIFTWTRGELDSGGQGDYSFAKNGTSGGGFYNSPMAIPDNPTKVQAPPPGFVYIVKD